MSRLTTGILAATLSASSLYTQETPTQTNIPIPTETPPIHYYVPNHTDDNNLTITPQTTQPPKPLETIVAQQAPPRFTEESIVNGASFTPEKSKGSHITIFGENLATQTCGANEIPFPTQLCEVTVNANGEELPLILVSPNQINALAPNQTGNYTIKVVRGAQESTPQNMEIQETAPALFTTNGFGIIVGPPYNANGLATIEQPARGDQTVVLYVNGLLPDTSLPRPGHAAPENPPTTAKKPQLLIGGRKIPTENIMFAGLTPGSVGLYQLNVKLPSKILDEGETGPSTIQICYTTKCSPETTIPIMNNIGEFATIQPAIPGTGKPLEGIIKNNTKGTEQNFQLSKHGYAIIPIPTGDEIEIKYWGNTHYPQQFKHDNKPRYTIPKFTEPEAKYCLDFNKITGNFQEPLTNGYHPCEQEMDMLDWLMYTTISHDTDGRTITYPEELRPVGYEFLGEFPNHLKDYVREAMSVQRVLGVDLFTEGGNGIFRIFYQDQNLGGVAPDSNNHHFKRGGMILSGLSPDEAIPGLARHEVKHGMGWKHSPARRIHAVSLEIPQYEHPDSPQTSFEQAADDIFHGREIDLGEYWNDNLTYPSHVPLNKRNIE